MREAARQAPAQAMRAVADALENDVWDYKHEPELSSQNEWAMAKFIVDRVVSIAEQDHDLAVRTLLVASRHAPARGQLRNSIKAKATRLGIGSK